MDIEGTTTSIDFVHQVLFPYASQHLAQYIEENKTQPKVKEELLAVQKTVFEEDGKSLDLDGAVLQLLAWIKADRKHTALKTLQGYLWQEGYETVQYKGHLYTDVVPQWKNWKATGIRMGIYSSGSVGAQKLLFGYSEMGDVTDYLEAYFDTKIGHKREVLSYRNIQQALEIPAGNILFLSDVEAELDAAKAAGMKTIQLVRPGTTPTQKHHTVKSFDEIDLPSIDRNI